MPACKISLARVAYNNSKKSYTYMAMVELENKHWHEVEHDAACLRWVGSLTLLVPYRREQSIADDWRAFALGSVETGVQSLTVKSPSISRVNAQFKVEAEDPEDAWTKLCLTSFAGMTNAGLTPNDILRAEVMDSKLEYHQSDKGILLPLAEGLEQPEVYQIPELLVDDIFIDERLVYLEAMSLLRVPAA